MGASPMGFTISDLTDPNWGLDNAIRSVKIGRRVRLRLFQYANFAGKWQWWETSQQSLGTWNAHASSLRVEDRSLRADCSNLPFNTVALYEHSDFRGDCRILPPGCYDGAAEMGFGNDRVSSVRNNAGDVWLHPDIHFADECTWGDFFFGRCTVGLFIVE